MKTRATKVMFASTSGLWWGLAALTVLCASAGLGFLLKSQVLAPRTLDDALNFMSVITAFLTTTAAIVMGLFINAAKNFVDTTADHWALYAAQLIRLDQCMRNYGPESEPMRHQLQSFTAGAIANCWRTQPGPRGVSYPDVGAMSREHAGLVLSELLNCIKLDILRLEPSDLARQKLAADCFDQYQEFARARWALLLGPRNSIPSAFLIVLLFWLMIIFVCFGLRAPTNAVAIIMIGLSAVTLSSMLFWIVDMVNPYEGIYDISSTNLRNVLKIMLQHNESP
ncbi:hypothetical protein BH09ACT8_BH09ACT8_07160 [soil metagenome]